MTVVIHRVIIIIEKIISPHIIHIPVIVIIYAVVRDFTGISPDVGCEVFMVVISACINYRYYYPFTL